MRDELRRANQEVFAGYEQSPRVNEWNSGSARLAWRTEYLTPAKKQTPRIAITSQARGEVKSVRFFTQLLVRHHHQIILAQPCAQLQRAQRGVPQEFLNFVKLDSVSHNLPEPIARASG